MQNSRFSILAVVLMIGLLGLLAVLQYRQLGQISDGEKEQMKKRLQADGKRFADDLNKEIRNAYFTFQIDPGDWLKENYAAFNRQFALWRSKTEYPNLIKDFYFVGQDAEPRRYDFERQNFVQTELTSELAEIKKRLKQNVHSNDFNPAIVNSYTLLLANRAEGREVDVVNGVPQIETTLSGYLVIELDKIVVERIIADLNKRYFSNEANSDYNLIITGNQEKQIIFQTGRNEIIEGAGDASIRLFDLSVSNYFVAVNSQIFSRNRNKSKETVAQTKTAGENLPPLPQIDKNDSLKVQLADAERKKAEPENKGVWLLTIRHREGSLENFISQARYKNLAINFGILGLLGVSIILIFLSARRAQTLAQRQLDFVSAVSHEFRTPLAVIYSAGENLSDGIVGSRSQFETYGGLIKREGKKLSQMVEQILEFAGARSGRKKYDFRHVEIEKIISRALSECRLLIEEKHFEIESDIDENLPVISADEQTLSQAIQNLIVNAVKYSGGSRQLKISANQENKLIKISVEDRGIGIAPKDLRYIFQPFYRAKEVVDRQIHGSGLGLNLVRQIIEAHGGKIEAESKIGRGSKFTIRLPFAA